MSQSSRSPDQYDYPSKGPYGPKTIVSQFPNPNEQSSRTRIDSRDNYSSDWNPEQSRHVYEHINSRTNDTDYQVLFAFEYTVRGSVLRRGYVVVVCCCWIFVRRWPVSVYIFRRKHNKKSDYSNLIFHPLCHIIWYKLYYLISELIVSITM